MLKCKVSMHVNLKKFWLRNEGYINVAWTILKHVKLNATILYLLPLTKSRK